MSDQEKLRKAAKLVSLIRIEKAELLCLALGAIPRGKRYEPVCSAEGDDSWEIQLQARLRAKHMNLEQLDALLEFYQSEMGASILAAQQEVMREFLAECGETFGTFSPSQAPKTEQKEIGTSAWVYGVGLASGNTSACSFCGDCPPDPRSLVAGKSALICEECVRISCEILREQGRLI